MAKVLVVDDRVDNRTLLVNLLGYAGHTVVEAGDGAEALALARAEHPDLVISDILMPAMDGYEFVRRLRSDAALERTPVIFCTGAYHEGQALALAEACGVWHVLPKPYPLGTILQTVREALATIPPPVPEPGGETFDREHLRLLTDKLVAKVGELEAANGRLEEEVRRRRTEQDLQASSELLHVLSRRLMEAQENERRTIARELHDEVGQALSLLLLTLHVLRGARSEEERASCLADSIGLVERTLQQVRDLSLDLRPSVLDDLGLVPALEWQADRLARKAGLRARVRAEGVPGRLAPELETACFRVAQEALTNVVRHARARQVSLELRQDDSQITLTVRDDGRGFDVQAAHERARGGGSMGLLGMRERAALVGGNLSLESAPGRGTEIRARFPLAGTDNGRCPREVSG